MKLWENIESRLIGMHADAPDYRGWLKDETVRLVKDWARQKPAIEKEYLQPMIYKPEAVLAGIRRSEYLQSGEGGHGYFVVDYVVNRDGILRIGFSHTFLSQLPDLKRGRFTVGEPVQAAGQIHYGGGMIQKIDNQSGHYKPHTQSHALLQNTLARAQLQSVLPRMPFSKLYSEGNS